MKNSIFFTTFYSKFLTSSKLGWKSRRKVNFFMNQVFDHFEFGMKKSTFFKLVLNLYFIPVLFAGISIYQYIYLSLSIYVSRMMEFSRVRLICFSRARLLISNFAYKTYIRGVLWTYIRGVLTNIMSVLTYIRGFLI